MKKVGGKTRPSILLRAPSIAVALSLAANTAAPAVRIEGDAPRPRLTNAPTPALLVAGDAAAPADASQAAPGPAMQPVTPVAEPTTPTAQPVTPTAQPVTPVAQPAATVAQPAATMTPSPLASPAASDKAAQENVFWQSVERSNTLADYQAYLQAFPNGVYAPLARNRIQALEAAQASPPAAPAAPGAAQAPAPASAPSVFGPPPAPVAPEALKAEVGTVDTEQALAMGVPARMELQMRLKALGLYAGPIDGDLGPGARAAIIEWQKRHEVAPTGELGPLQLAALRIESEAAFQQLAALAPPGAQPGFVHPSAFGPPPAPVSPEALRAEVGTLDTEQALAMSPAARMELQMRLKALGLYAGPIDGDLGPGARAAIIEWQKRHEVAPTGELGPLQLAALRIESEAAFQQMASAPPVAPPPYAPPRRVIYAAPARAEPGPGLAPVLGILGGIGLGVLGAKLGGKGGFGGKGFGGKGFGKGGKGEEHKKKE